MTRVTSESEPRRETLLKQLESLLRTETSDKPAATPAATESLISATRATLADIASPLKPSVETPGMGGSEVGRRPGTDAAEPQQRTTTAPLPYSPQAVILKGEKEFTPKAPTEFAQLHLHEGEVESLALKFLMHRGTSSGRDVAQQLGLSFVIIDRVLHTMKIERLVVLKSAAALGDFNYELTDAGVHRARKYAEHCSYFGSAPVTLDDYSASIAAQSLQKFRPKADDLRRAFADLTLSEDMFRRVGRAITSGMGLFLHGAPGNGKTSIAERVTRAYGTCIWIPRAISAWGEIIRVFDPSCHEEMPTTPAAGFMNQDEIDRRWVRIRRPTIVVGGELVMENLEITTNPATGISEAPIQLKSNCGTLVIDDFGRQQVPPSALLNRWIVPLEKRYDYLNLVSGRKIQVPFDQFVVFSTNLEPRDLVDEAFLRRIPYKVDVANPTEEQFIKIFQESAVKLGMEPSLEAVRFLIDHYYTAAKRPMRFCHPRDLLRQVAIYYEFIGQPPQLSCEALEAAAIDYFSVMSPLGETVVG
jgi:hypothetical protein